MNERKQRLLSVVEVLASVIRTIRLRRTFSVVSLTPTLVMWRVIYGNLTDMAVLEWCKLTFAGDRQGNQTQSALHEVVTIQLTSFSF